MNLIITLIKIYQGFVSPHMISVCRFNPSCSEYAIWSIKKHGTFKGLIKAFYRILLCNPLNTSKRKGKTGWCGCLIFIIFVIFVILILIYAIAKFPDIVNI